MAEKCVELKNMKSKIIDISITLKKEMPAWPKCAGIHLKFNPQGTLVRMGVHTGTHIDSPLHFIKNGAPIDKIPLEKFIGTARVIYLPKAKIISAADLEKLDLPKETSRILFRTTNSKFWEKGETNFQKDFVGLSADAALWIIKKGVKLVGIDYLSVAAYNQTSEVHRILLKNKVAVLEGLNLSKVKAGNYQLICLPLKLIGIEAAPTRAILFER